MISLEEGERAKYAELWSDVPEYRDYSPGLDNVKRFMDIIKPDQRSSLLDIGCGTGCAGLEFASRGLIVSWLDITDAGLLPEVPRTRFHPYPLWGRWDRPHKHGFDYGFCCDVMEHIPSEYSMLVVDRILSSCRTAWFQIALTPDKFGALISQPLHLTVKPFIWWLNHFKSVGNVVDARDLCGLALFVVKKR